MRPHFDTSAHHRSRDEDSFSAASLVEDAVYNASSYRHLEENRGFYDELADAEELPSARDEDAEAVKALFKRPRRGRPAGKAGAGKQA